MLRVYIAAPFQLQETARAVSDYLSINGCVVTSTWLTVTDMPDSDEAARLDLRDVDRADLLLLINPVGWRNEGTGGRHTEFGYALAGGKRLVILGVRTNVFHHYSQVTVVGDVPELLAHIATLTNARAATAVDV